MVHDILINKTTPWSKILECCFPRTGFNWLFSTHSISCGPHYKPHSHHSSLSLLFVLHLYTCVFFLFISLSHISHLISSLLSTLAVSDLVSSAVDGVLVIRLWCNGRAAALIELAKWISRGIQRALSLITAPSARWRVSLCVHRVINSLESFLITSYNSPNLFCAKGGEISCHILI